MSYGNNNRVRNGNQTFSRPRLQQPQTQAQAPQQQMQTRQPQQQVQARQLQPQQQQNQGKRSPRAENPISVVRSRYILVHNLNPQTIPATLKEYFEKFALFDKALLLVDENDDLNGSALITFRQVPQNAEKISGVHQIDNRKVRVEFVEDVRAYDDNILGTSSFRSSQNSTKMNAQSLALGVMLSSKKFVEEWISYSFVKYQLRYDQRRVDVFFTHLGIEFKLEYKFKDVKNDIIVERDGYTTMLTIPLRYPATFWKRNNNSVKVKSRSIFMGTSWDRVIDIPLTKENVELNDNTKNISSNTTLNTSGHSIPAKEKEGKVYNPLTPTKRKDFINIGDWTVLRITFRPPGSNRFRELEEKFQEASKYNLVPLNLNMRKPFMQVVKAASLPKPKDHDFRTSLGLDFNVLYTLESIISYHSFTERAITDEFYEVLKNAPASVSVKVLEYISTSKSAIYDPMAKFHETFIQMGSKLTNERSLPGHCAMLRKVVITPSRLYIQPQSIESTNRVIRHYKDYTDRFLRVQFMDEGFDPVGSAPPTSKMKDVIYDRIFKVLREGLKIGDRRYEFLAFSSSQLREQGCWFFASTPDLTANQIRSWMGVFSHEKVVAKNAIRMGQCFSSTRPILTFAENEVQYIPDVKHNGFTFSDGVGKIASKVAEEVALKMELRTVPSALQFRLGGAKGVLTVDKSLAQGNVKVQLRPSQIKFESQHLELEVIRTSTYISGFLNRQIITLLSCLGVKDEVFLKLMDDMLKDINRMLSKPEEAVRVLLGNVDEAGTVVSMVPIIQSGFLEKNDPYITNLINLFRVSILKDLKKKAKIIVPKGAYLLGVMDETNTLEEGEVFIQIMNTSNNGQRKEVITGEVTVFRNPCFHPGDVRFVKAVDQPALHHLLDVIVFSSKGFRDIPSMCSGGDLDGDDYTVYWDPDLLPPNRKYPPMDYTAAPTKTVDRVKIKDIIRFFVNYIIHDNLGKIANAHLANADLAKLGARDGKCLRLAQLHSQAVDFPKSGQPAELTDDLTMKCYPDFMQNKHKESYESKKVLGHIFRRIDKKEYKDYQSTLVDETVFDPRLRVPGMEMYIKEARDLRYQYNQALYAKMNQFGIQTEAEICSGYIIKFLKKGKNHKTRYEQLDYTMKAVKSFKSEWVKIFETEFYDSSKHVDFTHKSKIEAKAAAWYYVTYHPTERLKDGSFEGGFLSFPWIVYQYICEIAKRNSHKTLNEIELCKPFSETEIEEGSKKLIAERGDKLIIPEMDRVEDDVIEFDDFDYLSDDSAVEATISISNLYGNRKAAMDAAADSAATKEPSPGAKQSRPIRSRPLQAHESELAVDATLDELEKELLG